jgi:hypothetical protein
MSHPLDADGGNGPERRMAVNVLGKESWIAKKGESSSWGGGGAVKSYKILNRALELYTFL